MPVGVGCLLLALAAWKRSIIRDARRLPVHEEAAPATLAVATPQTMAPQCDG
jgi:hypothetical protein